jgi:hypothetical protein
MALVVADRVKETTATTGTGTYTLAGAVGGFESFASIGNANTTYYACTDGTDFEVGIGTYTASGTTLARTTILQSSNSDAAVSWSAGTKTIFCTLPAEKMSLLDASGNLVAANASNLTNLNASSLSTGTVANARLDQQLQDVAGLTPTDGNFIVGDGANFVAESGATARTSLGLSIGSDVQGYSAKLAAIAGLAVTDGNVIVGNGSTFVAESGATARASLGLTIGTDVQAYDAQLADVAGLTPSDGNFIVGDGANFVAESGATARTSLGLGTAATADSTDFDPAGEAVALAIALG